METNDSGVAEGERVGRVGQGGRAGALAHWKIIIPLILFIQMCLLEGSGGRVMMIIPSMKTSSAFPSSNIPRH